MERAYILLEQLAPNTGQVEGLAANPRQWTREELEKIKRSIQETPELLEARGLLVYPHGAEYVILGGNMRYQALQELGHRVAPCIIVDADTTVEKLRELVIKDNGSFGSWDWDELANQWDDLPLADMGVPVWEAAADQMEDTPAEKPDKKPEVVITFEDEAEREQFLAVYGDDLESRYNCKIKSNGS